MKLNVKVIAAVLGLVTMATMLAACTREVIKEVQVPQIVTETVVKEVPVEVMVEREVVKEVTVERVVEVEVIKEVAVPGETVVVEKEVVKEVPVEVVVEREVVREVEKVVEVEVASESAESSPSSSSPRPEGRSISKPVELSAGEVDDNERWEDYLVYRDSYTGPHASTTSTCPSGTSSL